MDLVLAARCPPSKAIREEYTPPYHQQLTDECTELKNKSKKQKTTTIVKSPTKEQEQEQETERESKRG